METVKGRTPLKLACLVALASVVGCADAGDAGAGKEAADASESQGVEATELTSTATAAAATEANNEPAAASESATAIQPAAQAAGADLSQTVDMDSTSPLERGRAFLAENGKREGVTTTASGLQYEVITAGDGPSPGPTDMITAHYHGTLIDGTVFDSSVQRGQPLEMPVNGFIRGWQEALVLMSVGDKWKLFVPPELAYGDRGSGPSIGPNETLIFEMELLAVQDG